MQRKMIAILSLLALVLMISPPAVSAAYTPPATVGAPSGLAVGYYEAHQGDYMGFEATVTASKELRAFVDEVGAENSAYAAAGYNTPEVALQLDYKEEVRVYPHSSYARRRR